MKKILLILVVLVAGGWLARTNPDEETFGRWVRGRVEDRLSANAGNGRLGRILTDLGSDIAGSVASKAAERRDLLLLSVYTIDVGADGRREDMWRFIGVGGRFFEVATPGSLR